MKSSNIISFITFLLLISFASVNAVLFTPALPAIAKFFHITEGNAQQTITWYLIAYAGGQLLYGPIANRYGRKSALYAGISLQIVSSFICVASGYIHSFALLVFGRFMLALGAGVGLKMTFTLVNEMYPPKVASQKLSYLMIAFAITPGLGVMLGGVLIAHFSWVSTFYAGAIYGVILLLLVTKLTETQITQDLLAFELHHLTQAYLAQFKNLTLIIGGMLMGGATCFVYIFAAVAPFIAINIMHMRPEQYGTANLIPSIGLILGSLVSAQLVKIYPQAKVVTIGIICAVGASFAMLFASLLSASAIVNLFIPMGMCYFGLSLVLANASTLAMVSVSDKAHGSAVMNFINMTFGTIGVLLIGTFTITNLLLPITYILIAVAMLILHLNLQIRTKSAD